MSKKITDFESVYDTALGITDTKFTINEFCDDIRKKEQEYENIVKMEFCHKIDIEPDSYDRCLKEIERLQYMNKMLNKRISELEYKLAQKELDNEHIGK